MIQFDEHIFQMGWFNHQLATYFLGLFNFLAFQKIYIFIKGRNTVALWVDEKKFHAAR